MKQNCYKKNILNIGKKFAYGYNLRLRHLKSVP